MVKGKRGGLPRQGDTGPGLRGKLEEDFWPDYLRPRRSKGKKGGSAKSREGYSDVLGQAATMREYVRGS